jgi:hypothetical protein
MPISRFQRIGNQLYARWKWLLSFRKTTWTLNDYPVVVMKQDPDPHFQPPRFPQHRFRAFIVNWALTGSGDSPAEARAALADAFTTNQTNCKQQEKPAFRPGRKVPIEFAPQDKIATNEALSEDFIHRVLELDWAWISDESTLWDFHTDQDNEAMYAKIREIYGTDVSDIQSARLWKILERIEESRTK